MMSVTTSNSMNVKDRRREKFEVDQAQAALDLANSTAVRWAGLVKSAAVSEQEADEKHTDLKLKTATVKSSQANLQRLEELQSFAKGLRPLTALSPRDAPMWAVDCYCDFEIIDQ
jgi:multidrug resistance efflux pump